MLGSRTPSGPEILPPRYARPRLLDEALALRHGGAQIIAGGTDFYPARVGRPLYDRDVPCVLDLTALAELRGIQDEAGCHRIGALTSWTEIAEAPLPAQFYCLQAVAREVGGRQIQNRGTIGGNLCNASPAADGVPALLALGAEIELLSRAGKRVLPLSEFIRGPRQIALRADEIASAVVIPKPKGAAHSSFVKLGARKYLVISIVMAAGYLDVVGSRIAEARIAVGACSPVAQRLPALEAALKGEVAISSLSRLVKPEHLAPLKPIDDVRASAEYREEAALTVVRRLLEELSA
ncbi:FAD binding domain-containing protein [Dongia deserti]|uniref:FAD binding domain-containing protein n=1 Tax=Dongia deserti TaxID=2268030 RepID=UPI000E655F16|nr:FAD binding domain-containing protein [Dongia deserti]